RPLKSDPSSHALPVTPIFVSEKLLQVLLFPLDHPVAHRDQRGSQREENPQLVQQQPASSVNERLTEIVGVARESIGASDNQTARLPARRDRRARAAKRTNHAGAERKAQANHHRADDDRDLPFARNPPSKCEIGEQPGRERRSEEKRGWRENA